MATSTERMPPLRVWRIPRVRYEAMVNRGTFDEGDPIELLDGLLVVREPEGSRHAALVGHIRGVLERTFGRGFHVREDKPLAWTTPRSPSRISSSFAVANWTTLTPTRRHRSWSSRSR